MLKLNKKYFSNTIKLILNIGHNVLCIYTPRKIFTKLKKIFAFTLAEVLITLGIIGIVAVLTLSSVIQNYTEQKTVNKVNQTYNILQNAVKQMIIDKGCDFNECWGDYPIREFANELPKYIKTTKKLQIIFIHHIY